MNDRIDAGYFRGSALDVAPGLMGMNLIRIMPDGERLCLPVTEIEIYYGMDDLACHASKGMTPRNRVMFGPGGFLYLYLVYGMHWMLNVVTGPAGHPEAILIRGLGEISGPGRVTRYLDMGADFYGEDLGRSERIWFESGSGIPPYTTGPRVGIGYAGEPWISMPWRYRV